MDDFIKILAIGTHWFDTSWKDAKIPGKKPYEDDEEYRGDYILEYAQYQYFTAPARHLVFSDTAGDVTKNFEFRYNGQKLRNSGRYEIYKNNEVFTLNINNIKLRLYNTGVAMLIFELEYHGDKKIDGNKDETPPSLDDVNKINEYGRRICFPFIPEKGKGHPINADKIVIDVGEKQFTEDNVETLKKFHESFGANGGAMSLTHMMDPIKEIIECGSGFTITSSVKRHDLGAYFVYPVIDDRMFVCCLVRDNDFIKSLNQWKDTEYSYLSDCDSPEHETSDKLYKFGFIENYASCQNRAMKKEILKKCVNARWADDDTIYMATHHSFTAVTKVDESQRAYVVNPFLTQYVELAIIALAQRATLLSLTAQAASLASTFRQDKLIGAAEIAEIAKLHEKYVKAQNQILIFTATAQEQGVELFDLMRSQLYISKNEAELDAQLKNLYEISNINDDRLNRESDARLNDLITIFTIFGLIFAVMQVTQNLFCTYNSINFLLSLLLSAAITSILVLAYYRVYRRYLYPIYRRYFPKKGGQA